ncbi:hypothetical protein BN110_018 [Yersinia phage phiR8-01]|uniref:Uncharacterized protein n=1 Tax=Yersinia phage phiR8-01 TaxID=1206556 RepID=I7J3R6_9CAUD|nr:hypothetical protein HOT05_gp07 [Yersinia phage phiR8-01]CCI88388.2 hypothetical protein BN110_018 [Yersinia phage phiR8-01]
MMEEVPFDCYGLYAVDAEGFSYHLVDRDSIQSIREAYAQCVAAFNAAGGVGYAVDYRRLLEIVS